MRLTIKAIIFCCTYLICNVTFAQKEGHRTLNQRGVLTSKCRYSKSVVIVESDPDCLACKREDKQRENETEANNKRIQKESIEKYCQQREAAAQEYVAQGKISNAIIEYESALKLKPSDEGIKNKIAQLKKAKEGNQNDKPGQEKSATIHQSKDQLSPSNNKSHNNATTIEERNRLEAEKIDNAKKESQKQSGNDAKLLYENNQKNLDRIKANTENLNEQVTGLSNAVATSYYASESTANAANGIYKNSSFDQKYNSIDELEAAYSSKLEAIDEGVIEYKQAKEKGLNNGYNYYMNTNKDATSQAVGTLMYGLGTLANEASAAKREREAKAQLEAEREEQRKRIEQQKRAKILAFRKDIFAYFKDGGIPMYSHNINAKEVYFFAYIFDKDKITNENSEVKVSNMFSLAQYKDKTWPFKNMIVKKINENRPGKVSLIGYYTQKEDAVETRNAFIKLVQKSNMTVSEFNYESTKSEFSNNKEEGNSNKDFWDTKQPTNNTKEKQPKSTTKKDSSFWD